MKDSALDVIVTPGAPAALGPYSQAIACDGLLFSCGQIGLDPETGRMVAGDAAAQAERALHNLGALLAAARAEFADVLKTTLFLTDMDSFTAVNEVYGRFFKQPFPARSCVAVAGLPAGALVEIEVIARLPRQAER